MTFNDKVVIVTGASSGIGAATAIRFAAEKAKVVLVGRQVDKLKRVYEQCVTKEMVPLTIVADVTKDADTRRIIEETIAHYKKIDILINNAGKFRLSSFLEENAVQVFDDIIATNVRSVVHLTHLAIPYLIQSKGVIVNVSSVSESMVVSKEMAAYSTSKAALTHFSKVIALELADKGIRVNCVSPGPVKTDILVNMGYSEEEQQKMFNEFLKTTALNRISSPEEVADLILFLASDKARGITGSSYTIDNGTSLLGATFDNLF